MTKLIVLAAGQGTRLRPLTDDRPKCMVEYRGRTLISRILESVDACGLSDVVIVTGYRADRLKIFPGRRYHNDRYATTNMVESLFCAEKEFDSDLIITYSDIIYAPRVLQALIDSEAPIAVAVDMRWRELWERRMEDPLLDAETLKLSSCGDIIELGKKPTSINEIQGQYIGLMKFSLSSLPSIINLYHSLDRDAIYDGKPFQQLYMTSFLQLIIDRLMPIRSVPVHGGWTEIDDASDLTVEPVDWDVS